MLNNRENDELNFNNSSNINESQKKSSDRHKSKKYPNYPIKRSKRKTTKFQQKMITKYGITRNELDCILFQLCQEYDCQWSVVATVLARQHNISISQMCVRDRYSTYLDPKIIKQWYTSEQQAQLATMFYLEGKSYADLKNALGDHGRGSLKKVMQSLVRRGLRKLEIYLSQQIKALPEAQKLPKGIERRCFTVSGLCAQNKNYQTHKYSYILFGYFVIQQGPQLEKIPKQLALALYRRVLQLSNLRKEQKVQHFNKIDPQIMKQTHQAFRQKMRQKTKAYRQKQKINVKKMFSQTAQDDVLSNLMIQEPIYSNKTQVNFNESSQHNETLINTNNNLNTSSVSSKQQDLNFTLQKLLEGQESQVINFDDYQNNGQKKKRVRKTQRKSDKVMNQLRKTFKSQDKSYEYLLEDLIDFGVNSKSANQDQLKIEDDILNELQINEQFDESRLQFNLGTQINNTNYNTQEQEQSDLYYNQVKTQYQSQFQ